LFYALFFLSTAGLELLRENYLTLNNWIAPSAGAIASVLLLYGLPRDGVTGVSVRHVDANTS
jgi:hypothetical protein